MIKIILFILIYFNLNFFNNGYTGVENKKYFISDTLKITNHSHLVNYWANYYSKQYDVPLKIIIEIFHKESGYKYDDSTYNAFVINKTDGSIGVGQIQYSTAKYLWKDSAVTVNKNKLLYDIRFNVHTSVLLLNTLKNKYIDMPYKNLWLSVLTAYNTGKPKPYNKYAYIIYNKYNNK